MVALGNIYDLHHVGGHVEKPMGVIPIRSMEKKEKLNGTTDAWRYTSYGNFYLHRTFLHLSYLTWSTQTFHFDLIFSDFFQRQDKRERGRDRERRINGRSGADRSDYIPIGMILHGPEYLARYDIPRRIWMDRRRSSGREGKGKTGAERDWTKSLPFGSSVDPRHPPR